MGRAGGLGLRGLGGLEGGLGLSGLGGLEGGLGFRGLRGLEALELEGLEVKKVAGKIRTGLGGGYHSIIIKGPEGDTIRKYSDPYIKACSASSFLRGVGSQGAQGRIGPKTLQTLETLNPKP